MNGTANNIQECRTLFEKLHLLSDAQLNTLLGTNIVFAILNVIVNGLSIWLIVVTKQYTNMSLRLTLYMSISDLGVAAISQQMMTYFLVNAHSNISCEVQVFCQYLLYLFPHLTGFFVGLVALDRYCRVKYTNKYPEVMTFKRQTIGLLIIIFSAMLNCLVLISGFFTGNWKIALLGIHPLDTSFVTWDIVLYWRSITMMKHHMKNNSIDMKNFSKSISKLASIYLVLVITFYPPYLLLDLVQVLINSSNTTLVFWHTMALIWIFLNSVIDAMSFLVVNRKARRQLTVWKEKVVGKDQTALPSPTHKTCESSQAADA